MLKLKVPFTIALFAHAAIFAAAGGLLPRAVFSPIEVTPVELVEVHSQEAPVIAPVKKAEPVRVVKKEIPVKAEFQAVKEVTPEVKREEVEEIAEKQEAAPEVPAAPAAVPIAVPEERTIRAEARESAAAALKEAEARPVAAADEMALFNSYIIRKIDRAKLYPNWARQRGYEGTVAVRFNVLPDGKVSDVKVVRPCKCDILNKAACDAIEKAAPFIDRPSSLGEKAYAMEVDIGFRLK